jgi:hypothetical protein
MKIEKIAATALGAYLVLIGPEDVISGGTTVLPSAAIGAGLLYWGLGVK